MKVSVIVVRMFASSEAEICVKKRSITVEIVHETSFEMVIALSVVLDDDCALPMLMI